MSTATKHARVGLLGGAALLLVLLGVLAMHGLGGHAAGHDALPGGHAVEPVAVGPHGHLAHEPVTDASTHLATDPGADPWWTALCLAVLAGAVLLAVRGNVGVWLPGPTRRPVVTSPVPGRRDRDPPSLLVLSVCRC